MYVELNFLSFSKLNCFNFSFLVLLSLYKDSNKICCSIFDKFDFFLFFKFFDGVKLLLLNDILFLLFISFIILLLFLLSIEKLTAVVI